jgi:multidrug efflux pump subunit AcrA (membrane-fusion protein)
VAPSSSDLRVINYVVSINPRVNGMVTDVPIVPNQPIRKGDILFKLDPTPFQKELESLEAQLQQQQASLVTAYASQRALTQQFRNATSNKTAVSAKLNLARLRVMQLKELSELGAGNKFDYEQAQTDVANLEAELSGAAASESQVQAKLDAKTPEGEPDEVATAKAQIANLQAKIADARWSRRFITRRQMERWCHSHCLINATTHSPAVLRDFLTRGLGPPPEWVGNIPVIGDRVAKKWQGLAAGGPEALSEAVRPYAGAVASWC